ncbi:acetyl/propionyl/methylcrotonyl-CoA carboxylase subunit alpha [Roseomonas populi]|uniref:Acetyl-CoA carboxylase biotin carboxylase subunit n=1 Tax=Roseomonas populi TaxID=3121582 RepID=A0ABT1X082_9PROT|nr:acetyl-CoA carboxylase biotin carboxylase subunit [Roseomonas pecuniae]MCR0980793.1 acetyl-CoA carboxylase biotin carboxylase subunit [Roseomonas pecuniae]
MKAGIRTLLVANRGEIALRIMRTARALGLDCVAIYSDADANAPHVRMADRAVRVGGAAPAESYLNIPAIIAAARAAGADAVHPGYGFLSENADFARACLDAGLVFVGPPPGAITAMGDKAEAKRVMRAAGLPCVPGYDGEDQEEARLAAEAEAIGYPVIVKATAGGGGRGMRIVSDPSTFGELLRSARAEAMGAFGSDRMLVERVVVDPRHVEIQVLVDRHGNGIHLGERDCSVQRRHQKLIEEAPAPGLDPALRDRMGRAAVSAAISIGYEGVGTFEFLLDRSGEFYFMEMNTRLQVEHPVTEAITGLDLVEWQLRVAMGEPLSLRQEDVSLSGHAIEVRLCAEDELRDFLPQSGRIALWRAPDHIRTDHAVHTDYEVAPFYDSMFAKLIAGGRNREDARRKLLRALRETVVFGIRTNRETLIRCLEHPAFAAGGVGTGFLDQHRDALIPREFRVDPLQAALAAAALCPPGQGGAGRPATLRLLDENGTTHEAEVEGGRVMATGAELLVTGRTGDEIRFRLDGVDRRAVAQADGDRVHVQFEGRAATFTDVTYAGSGKGGDAGADGKLRAAMSGRLASILVQPGEAVPAGSKICTVEAMKMEMAHAAPVAGTVARILVSPGQMVSTGQVLVEITPEEKVA